MRILQLLASALLGALLAACQPPPPPIPPDEPDGTAGAATAPATTYEFSNNFPTADAAARAREDADLQRAILAYRFWYPTVSAEAIFQANRDLGFVANESMPLFSAGPRHQVLTANSDTPYGGGEFDLSGGPLVIEMPPGAFLGLANDHHQRWIADMGIPGPDKGKGGKHLILPPDFEGTPPKGYFVSQADTNRILVAVRAIPAEGDLDAAFELMQKIRIYPLSTAAAPALVKYTNTTDRDMGGPLLKWEDNIAYWEKLHKVLNEEPVVDEYGPMYGLLMDLGIGKGQSFAPDARMKAILERAAREGKAQMLVSAFASQRPDRLAWPDRQWEWIGLVPGEAMFRTANGYDLDARDRWFVQAIVTSPAMFRRTTDTGSLYWLAARDSSGAFLDGGKNYTLSVPLPVPARLFWSVTVYDAATRTEVQTDQAKAALRSLFELKGAAGDSVDLHFGPTAPAGKEGQWIKTTAGRGWFAYFRIYGPDGPAFDGTWRPGDIVEASR